MKTILKFLIPLVGISCATGIPVQGRGPEARLATESLSYELIAPDGTRHFLVGTIHVRKQGDPGLEGALLEGFRLASTLCLEIDLADPALQANIGHLLNSYAVLPAEESLAGVLGSDLHTALAQKASSVGLDLKQFARFRPWFISLAVFMATLAQSGFSAEHGLDITLAAQAREMGKPIVGLETIEDQFSALASMSMEDQIRGVRDLVEEWEEAYLATQNLRKAFETRDVSSMLALIQEARDENPEFMHRVLTQRDQKMAATIARLAAEGNSLFVAIGAAHVIGEGSVPALLATKGWTVRAIDW